MTDTTKKFGRLLAAVGDLGEDLHDQGVIDLEEVMLTLPARRNAVRQLASEGKKESEIARELNIDRNKVRRDLGKDARNEQKRARNEQQINGDDIDESTQPVGHDLDGCGTSYNEDEETLWRNNLGSMAVYSIGLLSHWEKRFANWREIKVIAKDVELAEDAAKSWAHIATILKGNIS